MDDKVALTLILMFEILPSGSCHILWREKKINILTSIVPSLPANTIVVEIKGADTFLLANKVAKIEFIGV